MEKDISVHIEGEDSMNEIEKNRLLRKEIVDLADIWDGPESLHYGNRLQEILDKLEIKDVPDFYKKENIDRILKEMAERRKK